MWDDDWIPGYAHLGPDVLRNITGQLRIQGSPFGSVGGFPSLESIGGHFYVAQPQRRTSWALPDTWTRQSFGNPNLLNPGSNVSTTSHARRHDRRDGGEPGFTPRAHLQTQ